MFKMSVMGSVVGAVVLLVSVVIVWSENVGVTAQSQGETTSVGYGSGRTTGAHSGNVASGQYFHVGSRNDGPLRHLPEVASEDDVLSVVLSVEPMTTGGFYVTKYDEFAFGTNFTGQPFGEPNLVNSAKYVFSEDDYIGEFPTRSYNGSIPGPLIRSWPGQTLEVTIINNLGPENKYTMCCTDEALAAMEAANGIASDVDPFGCIANDFEANGHTFDVTPTPGLTCCHNCTVEQPGVMNYDFNGPNTTNFHTHGLHTSPLIENHGDSAPFIEIPPGATYTYRFEIPVDHWKGTLMYHAHKHGSTAFQVANGLFGPLIIGEPPAANRVPEQAWAPPPAYTDAEEVVLMLATVTPAAMLWMATQMNETMMIGLPDDETHPLCDINKMDWIPEGGSCSRAMSPSNPSGAAIRPGGMNCENTCMSPSGMATAPSGSPSNYEWTLVNQQLRPVLSMVAGVYQMWKVLYVSIKRYINLVITDSNFSITMTDKCELKLVAKDGILLNYVPRNVESAILASGNRADLMVRCSEPGFYFLISTPIRGTILDANTSNTLGPGGGNLMGINPCAQGLLADILVTANNENETVLDSLPSFQPPRPPMLRNTTDEEVAALPFNVTIKKQDIMLTDRRDETFLNPAQMCFVNGKVFSESEAAYTTTLGSLNEFRVAGIIQHPFHQHINSFQIALEGNEPDLYGGWFQDGDWHDTLFVPPPALALGITNASFTYFFAPTNSTENVAREANDPAYNLGLNFCLAQTGPDGESPGRFENGTCCCPAVAGSGCGSTCFDRTATPERRIELQACAALTGPDGQSPGRYEDGTCCCPPVPRSGCGQTCFARQAEALAASADPYKHVVNATMRWWAYNFTGYSIFHCHFVNHEDRGCMSWSSICDPDSLDIDGTCEYDAVKIELIPEP